MSCKKTQELYRYQVLADRLEVMNFTFRKIPTRSYLKNFFVKKKRERKNTDWKRKIKFFMRAFCFESFVKLNVS